MGINLTGFALIGGPASQDHKKAALVLKDLNVPYLCAVPLVFQSFEEWQSSELGLHPIQVALQVSLPEIDGAIEHYFRWKGWYDRTIGAVSRSCQSVGGSFPQM